MGPRSEDRGYRCNREHVSPFAVASMGPRSEDRGYRGSNMDSTRRRYGFNGSTVRGPWLSETSEYPRNTCPDASMGPRSEDRGYRNVAAGDVSA